MVRPFYAYFMGTVRVLETLNSIQEKSVSETLEVMSESLKEFKGNMDQFDDITMLCFEYRSK